MCIRDRKKTFPTYIQEDVILQDKIAVSAGKRGLQMILSPQDLITITNAKCVDVIK